MIAQPAYRWLTARLADRPARRRTLCERSPRRQSRTIPPRCHHDLLPEARRRAPKPAAVRASQRRARPSTTTWRRLPPRLSGRRRAVGSSRASSRRRRRCPVTNARSRASRTRAGRHSAASRRRSGCSPATLWPGSAWVPCGQSRGF